MQKLVITEKPSVAQAIATLEDDIIKSIAKNVSVERLAYLNKELSMENREASNKEEKSDTDKDSDKSKKMII